MHDPNEIIETTPGTPAEGGVFHGASWIWCRSPRDDYHRCAGFLREFRFDGGEAELFITARDRYRLWVNGRW